MVIFAGDLFEDKFQSVPTPIGEGLCVSSDVNNDSIQFGIQDTLMLAKKHVHDMYDTFYTCVSLLLCGTLRWDGKHIDILQSQTI